MKSFLDILTSSISFIFNLKYIKLKGKIKETKRFKTNKIHIIYSEILGPSHLQTVIGGSTCRHHIGGGMVGDWEALGGSAVMHYQWQSCRRLGIQRYKGICRSKRLATHSHKREWKNEENCCSPNQNFIILLAQRAVSNLTTCIYTSGRLWSPKRARAGIYTAGKSLYTC